MSPREFDFPAKNHEMARRAAWLIQNRELSLDADKLENIFNIFMAAFTPEAEKAAPQYYQLALFGHRRWQDAQFGDQRDARRVIGESEGNASNYAESNLGAQVITAECAASAIVPLREAERALCKALPLLKKASEATVYRPAFFKGDCPELRA